MAVEGKLRFTVPAGRSRSGWRFCQSRLSAFFEIRNGRVENQVFTQFCKRHDGTTEISLSPVNYDRELLGIEQTQMESAARIEGNTPSTWHDPKNGADFVIITTERFTQKCRKSGGVRQSQGLKTKVVLVEDIYDEFNFGEHSPEAIKEFLRTALNEWQLKPRYVLLVRRFEL